MKVKSIATAMVVALAVTVLVGWNSARDVKSPPSPEALAKAIAEAAKPGAEHARLQPLAGNWNYTCRCWMEPGKSPIEAKGTIDRKWILGGRFLEERVAGTGFDGRPGFEAIGLLGYNNNAKEYVSMFACNMGTGFSTGVGTVEASGTFTFQTTCNCPLSKQPVKGRDIIRIENGDRVVHEAYKTLEDGKEVKVMEIDSIRRK